MSEYKFAVGEVVRHHVGGDWRGIVMERDSAALQPRYRVRSRIRLIDGSHSEFVLDYFYEFELTADSEPPSGSPVGAVVPSGGGVP